MWSFNNCFNNYWKKYWRFPAVGKIFAFRGKICLVKISQISKGTQATAIEYYAKCNLAE